MALIETSLIWVTYAVCLGILFFISGIFVFIYQKPSERTIGVTIICFITVFSLLATVLLIPVDVALVSSTTSRKLGAKKDWATPDAVDNILFQLKVVYYTLYSLDAVLCLLVVPFTYFWYEEYDQVAAEEGTQSIGNRLWGAFKYTIAFLVLVVILFLVGFFVPVAKRARDEHRDLDYFKDLLRENRKCIFVIPPNGIQLTCNRWRTCLDLLPWRTYTYRHGTLLSIYCTRACIAPRDAHQVGTEDLGTANGSHGLKPTGTESRETTPARRPQRRQRGWP